VSQIEPKTCTLRLAARGQTEMCSHERCAFWDAGCLVERLGVDLATPDLASYLLEERERLERVRDLDEAEAAHREFSRRLGRDL
jgi:hypothetical protein